MKWKRLLAGLGLLLTASGCLQSVSADSGAAAYTFGSMDPNFLESQSQYVIYYSLPSDVHTGTKTNFTLMLYVAQLSGYKFQSQEQKIELIIITGTNKSFSFTVDQKNLIFYEGARWGPFNLTLSIDSTRTGLSQGSTTNASVFARLIVYEQYNDPKFPFLVNDGATMKLGELKLISPSASALSAQDQLLRSVGVGISVMLLVFGSSLAVQRVTAKRRRDASTSLRHLG